MRYTLVFLFSVCAFFAQAQRARVQSDSARPVVVKGDLIRPIKVWKQGQSADAEEIDVTVVYDGLKDSTAKFYYVLKDSSGASLAEGNVDVPKSDYRQWNIANNRINWAYNYVIRFLRLQQRNQTVN